MAHGDITREEYRVRIRTTLGNVRTEWARDLDRVAYLRERWDVVDVELVTRALDY